MFIYVYINSKMSQNYINIVKKLAKIYDHLELYTKDNYYIRDMIDETTQLYLLSVKNESITNDETKKLASMLYNLPSINYFWTNCNVNNIDIKNNEDNDKVNCEDD